MEALGIQCYILKDCYYKMVTNYFLPLLGKCASASSKSTEFRLVLKKRF